MPDGSVNWFNTSRDFGFIEPASGGRDDIVLVSPRARVALARPGDAQKVTLDVEFGRNGRESATKLALA